jgi:hypothetical protein
VGSFLKPNARIESAAKAWRGPFFLEYIIIGSWNIWKQRNRLYFDGITPSAESWLVHFAVDSDLLCCRVKADLREVIKNFIAGLRV